MNKSNITTNQCVMCSAPECNDSYNTDTMDEIQLVYGLFDISITKKPQEAA